MLYRIRWEQDRKTFTALKTYAQCHALADHLARVYRITATIERV